MKITNGMIKRAMIKRMALKGAERDSVIRGLKDVQSKFHRLNKANFVTQLVSAKKELQSVLSSPFVNNHPNRDKVWDKFSAINSKINQIVSAYRKQGATHEFYVWMTNEVLNIISRDIKTIWGLLTSDAPIIYS